MRVGGHRRSEPRAGFNRRLLAPLILGAVLNPVNSSIIAVSLVPIGRFFGAPPAQTAWLVSALYLATAIGQPVVGQLVDGWGPRRLFLIGAALTGIAGVLGALAPSLGVLIAARVILGFGTCAGYPAAMYLIRSESERTGEDSPGFVLTALAVCSQTVVVIGPALGGLLIGLSGWQATFAVNVPLAAAALWLGYRRLPRVIQPQRRPDRPRPGLDLPGILAFAVALTSMLLYLMEPAVSDLSLLAVAVVAAGLLVWRELHTTDPFLDLRVLGGNRPLLLTYLRTLLTMTITYAYLYGFSQWLQDGRGLSPSGSGLILLGLSGAALVVSATTGRRPEIRAKLIVGSVLQFAACGLLLVLDGTSARWLLVGVAVLAGLPQGLVNLANQNAVYHQASLDRIGSSAGLLRTCGYVGATVASAAIGSLFGTTAGTVGLHHLAIFLVVVGGLFVAVTMFDPALGRVGAQSADAPLNPIGGRNSHV